MGCDGGQNTERFCVWMFFSQPFTPFSFITVGHSCVRPLHCFLLTREIAKSRHSSERPAAASVCAKRLHVVEDTQVFSRTPQVSEEGKG